MLSGKFGTLSVDFDTTDEFCGKYFCCLSFCKDSALAQQYSRALIAKPEIIILDEPGTGLDVFAREYVMRTIHDLAVKTDLTIIYVTHIQCRFPR